MPLQYGALWSLLIYRNGRITYCKSRTSVETEIDLGLTSDLRSSGFELVSRIRWLIHHASYRPKEVSSTIYCTLKDGWED